MVAALGDRGRDPEGEVPLATLAALASSLVAALASCFAHSDLRRHRGLKPRDALAAAEEVFVSTRYALAAVEESAAEKLLQTLRRRRLSHHST